MKIFNKKLFASGVFMAVQGMLFVGIYPPIIVGAWQQN